MSGTGCRCCQRDPTILAKDLLQNISGELSIYWEIMISFHIISIVIIVTINFNYSGKINDI